MSSVHVSPIGTYLAVFGALMVFTALTVVVAFINLGSLNPVVALGVACIKATLVVLYFMHVKYSSRLTKLTVVLSLLRRDSLRRDPDGLRDPRLGRGRRQRAALIPDPGADAAGGRRLAAAVGLCHNPDRRRRCPGARASGVWS